MTVIIKGSGNNAMESYQENTAAVRRLEASGNRGFVIGEYSARAKATGKSFRERFTHVWTLHGGGTVRLQQGADPDTVQLARALGTDFSQERP